MLLPTKDPDSEKKADVAIANFLHGNALPFWLSGDCLFKAMCDAISKTPPSYLPPVEKEVGGPLLIANYEEYRLYAMTCERFCQ